MAIRFDSDQLSAARAERNAVVMAGAGSGKTSVLAERFVWLLAERGARVEEVLALTFTQKAAAEMFERIHRRLSQEGEAGLESLRAFDRAQISTLDAFCAQIARDASGMFGLPPGWKTTRRERRAWPRSWPWISCSPTGGSRRSTSCCASGISRPSGRTCSPSWPCGTSTWPAGRAWRRPASAS